MAAMKPCSDPGHRRRQSLEQIIPVLNCQHVSKFKKKKEILSAYVAFHLGN